MKKTKLKTLILGSVLFLSVSSFVYVNYHFYHTDKIEQTHVEINNDDSADVEQPANASFETKVLKFTLSKVYEFIFF